MTEENSKSRSPTGQGEPIGWLTVEQLAEHLHQPLELVLTALDELDWRADSPPFPGLARAVRGGRGARPGCQYSPALLDVVEQMIEVLRQHGGPGHGGR